MCGNCNLYAWAPSLWRDQARMLSLVVVQARGGSAERSYATLSNFPAPRKGAATIRQP